MEIPRIFLGFPLIGTEQFSFPAIINSLSFTPTENRDGVYLAQSDSDENIENQSIIEEACVLLVSLLRFAAEAGWYNAYELARIPQIVEGKNWLNVSWLREKILKKLIRDVRQTPAVINEDGKAISPSNSSIPLAAAASVEALWELWAGLQGEQERMTRRIEAIGWCDSVNSWARIYEKDDPELLFDEVYHGLEFWHRVSKKSQRSCQRFPQDAL